MIKNNSIHFVTKNKPRGKYGSGSYKTYKEIDDKIKKMSKDELITFIQNHVSRQHILSFAIKMNHKSNSNVDNSTLSTQTKDSSNDRVAAADILLNISTRLESPTNQLDESLIETRNDEIQEHRNEHNISTNIYEHDVMEENFLHSIFQDDFTSEYVADVDISDTNNNTPTLDEERITDKDHNVQETEDVENVDISGTNINTPTLAEERITDEDHNVQETAEKQQKQKDTSDIISNTSTLKHPETTEVVATSTDKNIDNQDETKLAKERNKKRCRTKHDDFINDCNKIQERLQK